MQYHFSHDRLTDIYGKSMKIQLWAERLMLQAFHLERLAINTEVIAAKAATTGRPFSVIAREVSDLARSISAEMETLRECYMTLARLSVDSAATARKAEKYVEALNLGISGVNKQLMERVLRQTYGHLEEVLGGILQHLEDAYRNARNLTRLSVHIPVVATMFRIEAARGDATSGSVFTGMSQDLMTFSDNFRRDLEQLLEIITHTIALFKNRAKGAA